MLERDAEQRSSLVRARINALLAKVEVDVRLNYEEPRVVHMSRESAELRELTATWTFEDLGDGRTRAAFETEFDPGRVLSMFARGPVVARLRKLLAEQPPGGLKEALEGR